MIWRAGASARSSVHTKKSTGRDRSRTKGSRPLVPGREAVSRNRSERSGFSRVDTGDRPRTVRDRKRETLGLERTQSAIGDEQYVETSRAGRDDVATSKHQVSVVIESAITKHGKLSFCKNHKIGTWNVRTMNTGKLDIVKREMERTRVEILGISELKWTEMGHFQSDEYKVFFCSQEIMSGEM